MISIFTTTKQLKIVEHIIGAQHRLHELVDLRHDTSQSCDIIVGETIVVNPCWKNTRPPVLYPEVNFSEKRLLGLVYAMLANYELAYPALETEAGLLQIVDIANRLQNGIAIEDSELMQQDYIHLHNKAISQYYNTQQHRFTAEQISNTFDIALSQAPNEEMAAFTAWHWAMFLLDVGEYQLAIEIIKHCSFSNISQEANMALKNTLCNVWMQQLKPPYDNVLIEELKKNLWECLEYYEKNNRQVEASLILNDAAHIATISNSYSESLGYINKAITIFHGKNLPELEAQAHLSKANLLHSWAKKDNPQFYRQAMQSYQQALTVFTKDETPDVFATIHHQLGMVYAEIPDEVKKKSVWAGVSVASFNEALQFYNKIDFPYEFAMICHSFGDAFTKYPQTLHTDNFDKALAWYREALDVMRTDEFPAERTQILCSYLEASWYAGNKEAFDEERYNDMMKVAQEILQLSDDVQIIEATKKDIKKLNDLKKQSTKIA